MHEDCGHRRAGGGMEPKPSPPRSPSGRELGNTPFGAVTSEGPRLAAFPAVPSGPAGLADRSLGVGIAKLFTRIVSPFCRWGD